MLLKLSLILSVMSSSYVFASESCKENQHLEIPQITQFIGNTKKINSFLSKKGFWGTYYIKQLCGSKYVGIPYNRYFPINSTLSSPGLGVDFKISTKGNGSISSHKSCQQASGEATSNQVPFLKNSIKFSVFSFIDYVYKSYQVVENLSQCKDKKFIDGSINVNKTPTYFPWQKDMTLPKNVGYYESNKKDSRQADLECKRLFNTTYINISENRACIGYTSNNMNEIKIITHEPTSPYITRIILRQKHNFNDSKVESCPVKKL